MRSEFEKWFKTTEAYNLLEEMNYFKIDLFTFKEHRSQYQHASVQIAYMTWQHQQAKVDELQEEFAEDERFLKEKIEQKEQQIVELKHLQSMDKDFIHALKNRCDELQKRLDAAQKLIDDWNCGGVNLFDLLDELEQALKGGEA